MELLKVSIITVTFNAESLLEATIQSVLAQTYPTIEYILIDGQSTDNTLSIIKKYRDQIALCVSEPDQGLYDAMNKGLTKATGDFVYFLNAGDLLFSKDTLAKVMQMAERETDILYGRTMLIDEKQQHIGLRSELTTRKLPKQLHWKDLNLGMVVCHQSILVRKTIAPIYLIDNLSADIDWVIGALKQSRKTTFTDEIIAKYLMGGISKQQHQQSLKDRFAVLKKHYGLLPTLFSHIRILGRAILFQLSKIGKPKYS